MAETEIESGIIDHLLDVEREANVIITAAQDEASAKLTASRADADARFKSKFLELNKALEDDFEAKREAFAEHTKKQFEDFKQRISASVKNEGEFSKFLDKVLSA